MLCGTCCLSRHCERSERCCLGLCILPFAPRYCCLQGEAIAFALGGNARMLRAHNLGALVNATPGVPPSASTAEVIIHFDLLPAGRGEEGSGDSCEGAARHAAAGCSHVGRLLVRRRVSRSGRSDIAVHMLPAPSGRDAVQPEDSRPAWQPITAAGLRDMLSPLGVQTDAVDRWGWGRALETGDRSSKPCLGGGGLRCSLEDRPSFLPSCSSSAQVCRDAAAARG
jgi:hypothetical protein